MRPPAILPTAESAWREPRASARKPLGTLSATNDGSSFHALFVSDGNAEIFGGGVTEALVPGTSCLLPAGLCEYKLKPLNGSARVLRTTL